MTEKPNKPSAVPPKRRSDWHLWLLVIILLLAVIALGGLLWFFSFCHKISLQENIAEFQYQPAEKTCIYSADGVLLAEVYDQDRSYVALEDISPNMLKAIVAIEDHRFYQHIGADFIGTLRALMKNIASGQVVQGGSTITQQLARNLFLTNERTYERKLKEIAIAIALERKFSKDEILEMYLNQIYFGSGYYGVETAAQKYFGKPAKELTLAESALLAGIPNRPVDYDLHHNLPAAQKRQRVVLQRMLDLHMISDREYQRAIEEEIKVQKPQVKNDNYRHPYFVSAVIRQLEEQFGHEQVYQGGLKVYTTLNTEQQNIAETVCQNSVNSFAQRGIKASNIALVSVVPQTGAVTALVGGTDFQADQNNMALIPRQPGSTIKPLVYAAALNSNIISPYSQINAQPREFAGYVINNPISWGGKTASVSDALRYSLNVPVAELVSKLGFEKTAAYIRRFGITTVTKNDLNYAALALGGMYYGVKPLEMAAAYAVFANDGQYNRPYFIEKVVDQNGKIIYQHQIKPKRVINAQTARVMHSFLVNVVQRGTGRYARIPLESAGKTGTTDQNRCLWFVGYTKNLATAVWVGNSDNRPVYGVAGGGSVAGPVWQQYMLALLDEHPIAEPPPPSYQLPPPPKDTANVTEQLPESNTDENAAEETGEQPVPANDTENATDEEPESNNAENAVDETEKQSAPQPEWLPEPPAEQ